MMWSRGFLCRRGQMPPLLHRDAPGPYLRGAEPKIWRQNMGLCRQKWEFADKKWEYTNKSSISMARSAEKKLLWHKICRQPAEPGGACGPPGPPPGASLPTIYDQCNRTMYVTVNCLSYLYYRNIENRTKLQHLWLRCLLLLLRLPLHLRHRGRQRGSRRLRQQQRRQPRRHRRHAEGGAGDGVVHAALEVEDANESFYRGYMNITRKKT